MDQNGSQDGSDDERLAVEDAFGIGAIHPTKRPKLGGLEAGPSKPTTLTAAPSVLSEVRKFVKPFKRWNLFWRFRIR